ncbi:serine O-acetyltransferase EpsC [Pseudobacteriovorax antillogorgiicola]|uniref:Serine O-acetyltransferase n=1 Tax=Pseudobacteriovorax antillogorgiicola TaxID=1513793 RepID=A0A1Y6CTE1_9BACT|nr:serine O-acetyltransferase EpsC [Pseudobacteriovorax antillogorgiicola]TCS44588.1 serine O-acetyltransferase [Pseudobacteriovorax antillogorgiicola]SMF78074.1 serine O-acetyltransferase [Pseudobacteriovorax antillogorgiicola]
MTKQDYLIKNRQTLELIAKQLKESSLRSGFHLRDIKSACIDLLEHFESLLLSPLDQSENVVSELSDLLEKLHGAANQIEKLYPKKWTEAATDQLMAKFLDYLPSLQEELSLDIQAAMDRDPASTDPLEIAMSYPSIRALSHHRLAHMLFKEKLPLVPRFINTLSHQKTGIDIHPGAEIGSSCFIDHGTGVVIGETAVIGDHCTLYQGVTLGAKSFPKNPDGTIIKGQVRHPTLESHITVYAGATILGAITIGHHSIIGGNVWLTQSLPAYSRIQQSRYQQNFFTNGDGI